MGENGTPESYPYTLETCVLVQHALDVQIVKALFEALRCV